MNFIVMGCGRVGGQSYLTICSNIRQLRKKLESDPGSQFSTKKGT